MRSTDPGYFSSNPVGRDGLRTRLPPQFGQVDLNRTFAQSTQNVHSNEQI